MLKSGQSINLEWLEVMNAWCPTNVHISSLWSAAIHMGSSNVVAAMFSSDLAASFELYCRIVINAKDISNLGITLSAPFDKQPDA